MERGNLQTETGRQYRLRTRLLTAAGLMLGGGALVVLPSCGLNHNTLLSGDAPAPVSFGDETSGSATAKASSKATSKPTTKASSKTKLEAGDKDTPTIQPDTPHHTVKHDSPSPSPKPTEAAPSSEPTATAPSSSDAPMFTPLPSVTLPTPSASPTAENAIANCDYNREKSRVDCKDATAGDYWLFRGDALKDTEIVKHDDSKFKLHDETPKPKLLPSCDVLGVFFAAQIDDQPTLVASYQTCRFLDLIPPHLPTPNASALQPSGPAASPSPGQGPN